MCCDGVLLLLCGVGYVAGAVGWFDLPLVLVVYLPCVMAAGFLMRESWWLDVSGFVEPESLILAQSERWRHA
jgi:hypothetical protein